MKGRKNSVLKTQKSIAKQPSVDTKGGTLNLNIPVMKKAVSAAPSMPSAKKEQKKSEPSSPDKTPPSKNKEWVGADLESEEKKKDAVDWLNVVE